MGSTVDPVGRGVGERAQYCEHESCPLYTFALQQHEEASPAPTLSTPEVGGRAGPEVLRVGGLPCPSSAAAGEWPCSSPGQHSIAGPEGIGMEELTLRMQKPEIGPHPLLTAARSELARAMLKNPPWEQDRGELAD